MIRSILTMLFVVSVAMTACDQGGGGGSPPEDGTTPADLADAAEPPADTGAPPDTQEDVVPDGTVEPAPFRVGAASLPLPAPLGTPICGNFPSGGPKTPFCANFPGSTTAYMPPTLRAIALEAGGERLLLVRADLIGIRPLIVHALEERLGEETGQDWTGRVLIGASHTHSSTGRIMPGMVWEILVDEFFPQLFVRIVDGFTEVALAALADLEPGAFGWGTVETDALHNDRRCENPPLQDDRLWVLRFDGDDGEPKALLLVHSLHGTTIGADALHFSRDAPGGIEEKVREGFDHPVVVMLWQAGTGDMAPNGAPEPLSDDPIPSDYGDIEGAGAVARDLVAGLVPDIATTTEVDLAAVHAYARIDRETLGYAEGEFPFEGGGAYCEKEGDQCWSEETGWTPIEGLDKACLDVKLFLGEGVPDKTFFSAIRIGDLAVVTYPGEPVTACTLEVEENIHAEFPGQAVVVVGYTQDYIGYSTPEEDWYQGAYEASGAIWGPKQGDYVTARVSELGLHLLDPGAFPLPFEQPDPFPVEIPDASAWNVSASPVAGTVVTEPAAKLVPGAVAVFEFTGGDPWLLLPRMALEKDMGDGAWEPVTWPSGEPVDGSGYEATWEVFPDPDYTSKPTATVRTYTWRLSLPTRRHQEPGFGDLDGTYRLRVTGSFRSQETMAVESYEVLSAAFTISD